MHDSLTIQWPYLLVALLLLWFPRGWMRVGKLFKKRHRERETMERFARDGGNDPEDKSVKLKRELSSVRNYVDFFRAFAGAFSLWHFAFEVTAEKRLLLHIICGVLTFIAVVIQTTRWREKKVTFFAAIFFLGGMSMGIGDQFVVGNYYAAAIAFLLVCAFNPIIATPRLFVTTYGFVLFPFVWLLGGSFQLAGINSMLVLLPPLFSLLAKRPMVIFTRKRNLGW